MGPGPGPVGRRAVLCRLQAAVAGTPARQAGGLFLEAGAGTGDAAVALRSRYEAEVVAIDSSLTMVAQARARGLPHVAVADGHRLPFRAGRFDGAWVDRVLQHVADPGRVLDELLRVVRPGGRVALADPDYDTQVLDIDDQKLARRVLRFRSDALLHNGSLAHRHAGLLAARGLEDITVEARTLVVRDPSAADNVMGLRTWAHAAAAQGSLGPRRRGSVRGPVRRRGARGPLHVCRHVLPDRWHAPASGCAQGACGAPTARKRRQVVGNQPDKPSESGAVRRQ
ncbi:methyltransferase domain-containing protein [Streptomyces syringium]|uniref:methyltransferase domain-containing protein n=1 Tax=Streptomyces syringium TaxID=76729 RepID=UPI003D91357E